MKTEGFALAMVGFVASCGGVTIQKRYLRAPPLRVAENLWDVDQKRDLTLVRFEVPTSGAQSMGLPLYDKVGAIREAAWSKAR